MKNRRTMILALAVLLVSACNKAENGGITFRLTEGDVIEATKGTVSEYASLPSEGAFSLLLTGPDGYSWDGSIQSWDSSTALAAGSYTASVKYGDETDEGYSKPCFVGSTKFTVANGTTTDVTIPVTLGNSIVKLACTDAFNNYYPSSSFKVVTGSGNEFAYTGSGVFVESYRFSISGTVTAQNGKTYTISTPVYNAEAAVCYTVKFDVDNVGGVSVKISFDDSVTVVELEEDLNS